MVIDIKHLLKDRGIQFKELASQLGVTDVALRQSLNGNPTYSRLKEIADALGVEVAELFASSKSQVICPHCGKLINIKIE